MNFPKVSVVTITYGHEKFISETINGVISQRYSGEIEFIIANDNSPDDTDNVVERFLQEVVIPPNISIKYTRHHRNKGMIDNFLWAFNEASGKYIALCEGDDYWTDSLKLHKQVEFLEANAEYVLSNTDCDFYYENSGAFLRKANESHRRKISIKDGRVSPEDLLDNKYVVRTASVVFRRDLLAKYYTTKFHRVYSAKMMMGDTPLWTFLSTQGKFHYLNYSTMIYRISDAGASNMKDNLKDLQFHINICDMRFAFISDEEYALSRSFEKKNILLYNHLNRKALSNNFAASYLFPGFLSKINSKLVEYTNKYKLLGIVLTYKFRISMKLHNTLWRIF